MDIGHMTTVYNSIRYRVISVAKWFMNLRVTRSQSGVDDVGSIGTGLY